MASVNYYLLYSSRSSTYLLTTYSPDMVPHSPPSPTASLLATAAAARPVLEARLARVKDAALSPAYA